MNWNGIISLLLACIEFLLLFNLLVFVKKDKLNIMNVGDSRAYLLHKNDFRQVNYDHSFVGEAIRAGLITHEDAMTHPKKNQLTQSVSARNVEVIPFFGQYKFEAGDSLLLCSDGLWGVVAESMIVTVLKELSAKAAAAKLVELANSRGGPDNISVIVCKSAARRLFSFVKKSGNNGSEDALNDNPHEH